MQVTSRILLCTVTALCTLPALAGEAPPARELLKPPQMSIASPITDRFSVRGVFHMPSISTEVRYDSSTGTAGTLVSGEDVLGWPDQRKDAGLDMMFRMGENHRIRADFYKLARSGAEVITQQIRFGDNVYLGGDRVLSKLDMRKLDLTYTYSIIRREKFELGFGLGIHLLQVEGELNAPARFVREMLDTAGPFPTLAADFTWRFTKRFSVNLLGQYFDESIDDVSGSYQAYHGDVQFRARRNLAFGLGYTQTHYRIDSTDPDFTGFFNLKYKGPEAFFQVSF